MNVTKMTFRFYDRTKEPADLRAFSRRVEDDASRMVIISGRRRIGRTTLANPAFTNGPLPCLFSISAMKKGSSCIVVGKKIKQLHRKAVV